MSKIETQRLDFNRISIKSGNSDLQIILFANEAVEIDRQSIAETKNIFEIQETVEKLNGVNFFGELPGALKQCLLTPDFHKGAGIPVGTVMETEAFGFLRYGLQRH
jgi:tRNA-splicing ligase RtcB